MTPQAAPIDPRATRRRSSDSVWPLRGADGLTFAERKARDTELTPRHAPRPRAARSGTNQFPNEQGVGRGNPAGGE